MKIGYCVGAYVAVGVLIVGSLVHFDTSYCPKQPRAPFLVEIIAAAVWPAVIATAPFAPIKCAND